MERNVSTHRPIQCDPSRTLWAKTNDKGRCPASQGVTYPLSQGFSAVALTWDQVRFCCEGTGAVLGRVFNSILASTLRMQVRPQLVSTTKTVSGHCSVSSGGTVVPLLRSSALDEFHEAGVTAASLGPSTAPAARWGSAKTCRVNPWRRAQRGAPAGAPTGLVQQTWQRVLRSPATGSGCASGHQRVRAKARLSPGAPSQ